MILSASEIMLLSPQHGILLEKRSTEENIAPDRWSLLGGDSLPKEPPTYTASRVLEEKLGLPAPPEAFSLISVSPVSWAPKHLFTRFTYYLIYKGDILQIIQERQVEYLFVSPRIFEEIDVVGYSKEEKRAMLMWIATTHKNLFS